jgi:RNA polymerase sigma-70 factor (ECF subfamily)
MRNATYDAAREQKLVQALLGRDAAAWREFRRRHDRLVWRCITRVTSRFDAVTHEDVREIQARWQLSLLANDMAKLRAFDRSRGSTLSSYIAMLAIHCAYDWLRAFRRELPRASLGEAKHVHWPGPDPFETLAQRERAGLAARALAGFTERERVFATLCFAQGLEPREIADFMNISVKTVYSKKHKIMAKLEAVVATINAA